MDQTLFNTVDAYIDSLFVPEDPVLDAAQKDADAAGMPLIAVSASQGKFLYLMAKAVGVRRILELGTLAGVSTIWLARALPDDGALVTCEFDPGHAQVAKANIARAGLDGKVTVEVGPALDTLKRLTADGAAPFDLVFLDADKGNYTNYLEWSLKLTRPGSLILADNVVRAGKVLDPESHDDSARGAAAFNRALAAESRVEAVAFQQIGTKGHDGMAMALVKG